MSDRHVLFIGESITFMPRLLLRYANQTCQSSDWRLHKFECKSIKKWFESGSNEGVVPPSEPVRCIGRILWAIKEDKTGVIVCH